MIYPQEIAAMESIIAHFQTQNYVMLLAPMQSGKTATYKLTACEMLRQGSVDRVVIFSGNREKALHLQTADHGSFRRNYREFLRRTLSVEQAEAEEEKCKMEVVWGPKLKKFVPKPRTLYIWEESHYAQSQGQQVDAFLQKCEIQATGEVPDGCFVLSVSATPFSELSDNHHLTQDKPIVRLVPGERYLSVKKMWANRQIQNIPKADLKTKFPMLLGRLRRYALVRVSNKNEATMIQMAQAAGCNVKEHNMKTDTNLGELLELAPTTPTVIFIKGMCRMGQRINKTYIDFCIESSTNTDTILQGLLGRCCGYDGLETIKVYIVGLKVDEIQRFIRLYDGELTVPRKAANITEGVIKVRRPIIPMRLPLDEDPEECEAREILGRMDEIENHNTPEDTAKIMPILRSICQARAKARSDRTPSEKELAKGWKLHVSGEIFCTGLPLIRDAYRSRIATSEFGSGGGASATKDEVVVYIGMRTNGLKVMYIAMQIEDELLAEQARIPVTTRKEVFCQMTEAEESTPSYTMTLKPEVRTDAALLEQSLHECMQHSRSVALNAPTLIKGPIILTESVFQALNDMKPRFLAKGFVLEDAVMRGRKPSSLGTDVRLASISWKIVRATASTASTASTSTTSIGEEMLSEQ